MDFEVKEGMKIALSVVIFSTLLLFALILGNLSYDMKMTKEWTDSFSTDMQLQTLVYQFDLGGTPEAVNQGIDLKTVRGSDIVNLILKYNKTYTYDVDGFEYSAEAEDKLDEAGQDGKEIWSQRYLTDNIIGSDLNAEYYSYVSGIELGEPTFHFQLKTN